MIKLDSNKQIADIAKELEKDLRMAINPKDSYAMEKAGLWNQFPAIVDTILALGSNYQTEAFMVGGSLVQKSQYLVPKFFEQIANSQVIWFNSSSVLRKPLIQVGTEAQVKVFPSDVEYFFNAAGIKVSSFTSCKYGLMDFTEIGLNDSELTIQLSGTLSSIPLAILGIVGSDVDVLQFNTGVQPNEEERRQWIKAQIKETK